MSKHLKSQEGTSTLLVFWVMVLIVAGIIVYLKQKGPPIQEQEAMEEIYLPHAPLFSENAERITVQLLYPDRELTLQSENREIYQSKEPVNRLRQVMVLLLRGPRNQELLHLFPEGIRLRELYLHEGCAYVDLQLKSGIQKNIGCIVEHLALQSIQETLTRNFPEVEKVKVLINGSEESTLFGHIDIRKPFSHL